MLHWLVTMVRYSIETSTMNTKCEGDIEATRVWLYRRIRRVEESNHRSITTTWIEVKITEGDQGQLLYWEKFGADHMTCVDTSEALREVCTGAEKG